MKATSHSQARRISLFPTVLLGLCVCASARECDPGWCLGPGKPGIWSSYCHGGMDKSCGTNSTYCFRCCRGFFGSGDDTCRECTAGYYCPLNGTVAPTELCTIGSYCPAGVSAPIPCPAGKVCGSSGMALGMPCSAGAYCNGTGTIAPTRCAEGGYCPSGSIVPTVCPVGRCELVPGSACAPGRASARSLPPAGGRGECLLSTRSVLPAGGGGETLLHSRPAVVPPPDTIRMTAHHAP